MFFVESPAFTFCDRTIRDKNIVYFYGVCISSPRIGIIMEYCPNGTLDGFVTGNNITLLQKLKLLCEIIDGLRSLHKAGIVHRDLKPKNVLIDADMHAKLTDFGISKKIEDRVQHTAHIGTPYYMAPEVTLGKPYNTSADIFSFGILLYELITGNWNLSNDFTQDVGKIASDPSCRPQIPDRFINSTNFAISSCCQLMKMCWNHDPNDRPTIDTVCTIIKQCIDVEGKQPASIQTS